MWKREREREREKKLKKKKLNNLDYSLIIMLKNSDVIQTNDLRRPNFQIILLQFRLILIMTD